MVALTQNFIPLYIGGQRRAASDNSTYDVFNPSNGQILAKVAAATADDWCGQFSPYLYSLITRVDRHIPARQPLTRLQKPLKHGNTLRRDSGQP